MRRYRLPSQTILPVTFLTLFHAGSNVQPGILPLAINEIMTVISETKHRDFLIRCSYIEIYKETITDLLGKKNIEVHESKEKVRMFQGLLFIESITITRFSVVYRACTLMLKRRTSQTQTKFWNVWHEVKSLDMLDEPA